MSEDERKLVFVESSAGVTYYGTSEQDPLIRIFEGESATAGVAANDLSFVCNTDVVMATEESTSYSHDLIPPPSIDASEDIKLVSDPCPVVSKLASELAEIQQEETKIQITNTPEETTPLSKSSIKKGTLPPSSSTIFFTVTFYLVTSIAMVIVNKMVLKLFSLPLTLLWIQLAFASVFLKGIELFGGCAPFSSISRSMLWRLSPLILINVVGLAMNTLCLHALDASLYQVARALILPFTVILSSLLLHQSSSIFVILSCGIVTCGFLIGIFVEKEVHISTVGVIFGIISSLTSAIHSIIIKKSLRILDGALELVYYNNYFSAILLFPLIFLETDGLATLFSSSEPFFSSQSPWMFMFGSILAGVCGLLINVAGFLQIKVTSPITHTLASASRSVLQTILAVIVLGEVITAYRIISIFITLFGTVMYTWVRAIEMKKETLFKLSDDVEDKRPSEFVDVIMKSSPRRFWQSISISNMSVFGQHLRPIRLPVESK